MFGSSILFATFAIGFLAVALHGWLREEAPRTRAKTGPATNAPPDLLRLIVDQPAGSLEEGEKLDQHLQSLSEALLASVKADAVAIELIESNVINKAFPAGFQESYSGIRMDVRGTPVLQVVTSGTPMRWQPTPEAPPPANVPGIDATTTSMIIAPIKTGPKVFGVLRALTSRRPGFSDADLRLLETVGFHLGTMLWKAPERNFTHQEAEREQALGQTDRMARIRFERLTDTLESAFWITDPEEKETLLVNSGFLRLWKREPDVLARAPRAWTDNLIPQDRKRVERALQTPKDEGVEVSFTIQRPDGTQAGIRLRRFPMKDDRGILESIGYLAADNSAQSRLAGDLAAFQRRLGEASETGPVISYAARPDGDYGLTYVSPNVEKTFGYAPDRFVTDPTFWSAHLHPDDQTRVFEGFTKLFQKGRYEQEYRFRHTDGTYRIIRDVATVVRTPEGDALEIVGYWVDMTEQKRAEEGMQYSLNRIKDLQESRTKLLNNIAHDLTSPLTPIGLQLHMMKNVEVPPQARKAFDVIGRNIEHMKLLIQDLHDVARLEAGQLKVDFEPIDIALLVKNAAESFQDPARERGITLVAKLPKTTLPAVADAQRINQVVFNFITNALKFTAKEGKITLAAEKQGANITVKVTDSGRGLTREEIDKLFKPFSQVHDRAEYKEKGTGLGLYICKALIEKHNGRTWVESEGRGKGSTFAFQIPLKGEEKPVADAPAQAAPAVPTPAPTPPKPVPPADEPAAAADAAKARKPRKPAAKKPDS